MANSEWVSDVVGSLGGLAYLSKDRLEQWLDEVSGGDIPETEAYSTSLSEDAQWWWF